MRIQIPVSFAGVARTWIKVDHRDSETTTYCYQYTKPVNCLAFGKENMPTKTALASATCPLGTHSSEMSSLLGVIIAPELKQA